MHREVSIETYHPPPPEKKPIAVHGGARIFAGTALIANAGSMCDQRRR